MTTSFTIGITEIRGAVPISTERRLVGLNAAPWTTI